MAQTVPKALSEIPLEVIETDLLIVGGGNAGCFAAVEAKTQDPSFWVAIMEKAHISRSGATGSIILTRDYLWNIKLCDQNEYITEYTVLKDTVVCIHFQDNCECESKAICLTPR